ncbi:MAG: DUF1194 domain-containing protein, partial [Alphaproteobacteria bacterium]
SREHGSEVDLLLVLAVDVSESINRREAWLQRFGHAEALADPLVIAAINSGRRGRIAIAYLEWAGPGEQRQVIGWTLVEGRESAEKLTKALLAEPISGGYWTSISAALDTASRMIAAAPFKAPRRVIDLSSDGRNNAGEPIGPARKRVLDRGITVNGLPVMAMRRNFTWPPMPFLDRYFTDCVIGGPGAFSELVERSDDFARIVRRKLIREIVGTPPPAGRVIPAAGAAARPKIPCSEDDDAPGNARDKS